MHYEPLIITASALPSSMKTTLMKAMSLLGGHIINEWSERCQYLVMNAITLTTKVRNSYLEHPVPPIVENSLFPVSAQVGFAKTHPVGNSVFLFLAAL